MSEAKHTPGPWRLDAPVNAHVISEDYHTIDAGCGFLASADQREPGFGLAGHMTLADALLIAAAPDYHAAADKVPLEARLLGPTSRAHIGGLLRAINELRDAHAKATGGAA